MIQKTIENYDPKKLNESKVCVLSKSSFLNDNIKINSESFFTKINFDYNKISIESEFYPFLLKNINNPPSSLYVEGNINLLNKPAVAIVGTRKPSNEAKKAANKIAKYYGKMGFVIVSGLALGIDTISMNSALSVDAPVIGVLPSPLNDIVPKKNRKLAESIIERGGLLISEYSEGSNVYKSNYINRNRIISGISLLTIIVETSTEGGTMHTVNFAKDQKRPIIVADLEAEGNKKLKEEGFPIINLEYLK